MAVPAAIRTYLDENRDQLWAEALARHKRGIEARLPEDLKPLQRQSTDRARSRDVVMEDAITEWLDEPGHDEFRIADLAYGIGLIDRRDGAKLTPRNQHRITAVLYSLGYGKRKTKIDGSRGWYWRKG